MRLRIHPSLLLFFFLTAAALPAQVTLFSEDFNDCVLPLGWQVKTTGNPDPVWYVSDAITNDDNTGQSMNGSCFLFIDDDATGDNTPAYTIDFVSPPFDCSQTPTVELTVDVHYRDWYAAEEYFDVLITDGATETLLSHFDKTKSTGDSVGEYVTLKFDLSLVTQSAHAQLIFRYNDAGGYNWWAGFDNVLVRGYGEGKNIIAEAFNSCTKPAGWETNILTGNDDWQFGFLADSSKGYGNGASMDGSCMVFFDDDIIGQAAAYSTVRLFTPWFDGTAYSKFELNFDLILRYYKENVFVYVEKGDGTESTVEEYLTDVGGPFFPNYVHQTLDLSPYRAQQMRVIFEYTDGNDWGWWAGLDNVKVTGKGAANDLCTNALPLITDAPCLQEDNLTAVFDGPPSACAGKADGSLWFRWKADFSGVAQFNTKAQFNDIVNVYAGACASLEDVVCNHRDEHGFNDYPTYFQAENGVEYLLRVSGQDGGFGQTRGTICAGITQAPGFPPVPANEECASATGLAINGPCVDGNNFNAGMTAIQPSLNELARADVWYKFVAPSPSPTPSKIEVLSHADFSDIITVYSGGCNALQEIAGNHEGQRLELPVLTAGDTYYVQIAGNFATIEGNICAQVTQQPADAPSNDNCITAAPIALGASCTSGSNLNASPSGYVPDCVEKVDHDVWFSFKAPSSGAVRINTGADFEHALAVWEGNCVDLHQVYCAENPLRCQGFITVGNLAAGQTYYLQIASWESASGLHTGNICLRLLDGFQQPDFQPLNLQVEQLCTGLGTANLIVSANGGVPPYQYPGYTNGQPVLSGDAYLVVVADAMGCEQAITGIVDDCTSSGCTLLASATVHNPLCHDDSNGGIALAVVGGNGSYTYLWSNGATSQNLSDVPAGDYSVTVSDAGGCETILSGSLANPPALEVETTVVEQPNQGFQDGAIHTSVSGGTGVLLFQWMNNGVLVGTTKDLSGVGGGTYILTVTDENGCTTTLVVTLTETVGTNAPEEAFQAEVFPNPAGDRASLLVSLPKMQSLNLSLSDAAGRALLQWNAEQVLDRQIPIDLKGLPDGVYSLRMVAGEDVVVRKVVKGL